MHQNIDSHIISFIILVLHLISFPTVHPAVTISKICSNSHLLCSASTCYNPITHFCFNETLCDRRHQLCYVQTNTFVGYKFNLSSNQCYDPSEKVCFNHTLCNHPSRSCNQQCLAYNEVRVNGTTICRLQHSYYYYKNNQIQLCKGNCYDSKVERCVNQRIECINNCDE